jgi:hypothetical protein
MTRRLLYAMLAGGLIVAAFAAFTLSAAAQDRTFLVRLPTGETITVTVDVAAGIPMSQVPGLPGTPIQELTPGGPGGGAPPPGGGGGGSAGGGGSTGGDPSSGGAQRDGSSDSDGDGEPDEPSSRDGERQQRSGSDDRVPGAGDSDGQAGDESRPRRRRRGGRNGGTPAGTPMRHPDGSPTRQNPGFFDALPGPSRGVPNFVIRKFRVPIFLLPIYQSAGIQYGIRWEVLAAINEIETDYGRNLNVSSAGAVGWMQFMPGTWRQYGVDANRDKKKDPYNPVDAIFAAARYLKAAGYENDVRRAVFAYNHADWYVDSVLLRAKLIAGIPGDLVGSLTGLTEGRFPVAARARYADDMSEREAKQRIEHGENASRTVEGDETRTGIDIFSQRGAPIVAVNDGVIKRIGHSRDKGFFVELQDVYGNRYRYLGLGSVSRLYPVPKQDLSVDEGSAKAISANPGDGDPRPTQAASAGSQPDAGRGARRAGTDSAAPTSRARVTFKRRLFAHPNRPNARRAGGLDQIFDAQLRGQDGFENYENYFVRGLGLNTENATLKRLKPGSRVVAGTILGRVGQPDPQKASHMTFEIRPAGRGAPSIDPKPILDGWKLLESTAIYRANGKNVLYGDDGDGFSIGQILLLPKPLLERRVLSDSRIDIYPCGRRDVRTGQIDRRVLATMAYLSEAGLRPTVTSLKCGHSVYTSSGNVSHHSSGNAVDIAQINGTPILGHQEGGGITETTVKRLMMLQGTMEPAQIISLLDMGRNTVAMGDHNDHIHVGFRPLFGDNRKLGRQANAILKPGQWEDLMRRLRSLPNPVVRPRPSRASIPANRGRASRSHRGE